MDDTYLTLSERLIREYFPDVTDVHGLLQFVYVKKDFKNYISYLRPIQEIALRSNFVFKCLLSELERKEVPTADIENLRILRSKRPGNIFI